MGIDSTCWSFPRGLVAGEVKELARNTAAATTDVGDRISAIQQQVDAVDTALTSTEHVIETINETHAVIGGVLNEQMAITRASSADH